MSYRLGFFSVKVISAEHSVAAPFDYVTPVVENPLVDTTLSNVSYDEDMDRRQLGHPVHQSRYKGTVSTLKRSRLNDLPRIQQNVCAGFTHPTSKV